MFSPQITRALLTNPAARPGRRMPRVKGIVLHWVANPGTSAMANRNYFETGVSDERQNWASAHYIVDPDQIIQAVPDDEIAYHVGATRYNEQTLRQFLTTYPNDCLIGIELCHTDWEGNFHPRTWEKAVQLTTHLCLTHGLEPEQVVRHFDVTYKECPRLMVRTPRVFEQFRSEVRQALAVERGRARTAAKGEVPDWAVEWIDEAVQAGILTGFPDGSLRLDEPVTRLQAAVMVMRAVRMLQGQMSKEGAGA